ncbi:MAG TPA: hypothetical protein VIW94_02080 [Acidimicrobiia bacterium]
MRNRLFILLSLFALVMAACSTPSQSEPGTASPQPEGEAPPEVLLSYELADGASYVYDVTLVQTIQVSAEGNGAALDDEDIPESADINVAGTGQFTFDVADGPDEGTYEVTITGELTDLNVTGTVDGEPVSGDDIPDFADVEPVSTTVVVDDKGNIIPADPSVEDPFGDLLGGLEGLGGMGSGSVPGAELGQFFGPPFGDEAVTVGDTWSATVEVPGFGSEPITTTVESEVTGTDTVGGVDVLVIDTSTVVSAFEVDLADFFIGLFTGFLPDDATAEEQAQIDELVENLRFVISSDETTSTSKTLFDPESGMTQTYEVASLANLGFDLNFPDEETGELSSFVMDMSIDQTVSYELATDEPA